MKDATKLDKIKEIIADEYGDLIPNYLLEELTSTLYDDLFDDNYRIMDALLALYSLEDELEIESSSAFYAFDSLLDILDENETTANNLYNCFLEFNEFGLFSRLITDYDEYLSAEQLETVKRIGIATFDKELLKMYGVID